MGGALVAFIYALISLLRFRSFTVTSWDNAIFEQAIKAYAHLDAPIVTIKGPGYNILGDHFSPITMLVAPIYRVFPFAQTLLIVQAVLVGVSVVVVIDLANRHLGTAYGLVIGAIYAVSFGLQSAVIADFHEVAFAVPLMAIAGAAFVDGRFDHVIWWSLPLILVKEDLGITVAAIGLALWLAGERRRGVVLAVVGLLATVVVVWVVIPSFNAGGAYDYSSTLGGDRGVMATLFTDLGRKALTVVLTVAITGGAALWSPWAVVAVPTFLWRFLGDNEFYWGTDWHYSMILMPIVFVALIDGFVQHPRIRVPSLVLALAVTGYTLAGSPLASLVSGDLWAKSPRDAAAHRAMAQLPEGSSVESDLGLLTHLASDHELYWRGTVGAAQPDYIVFDTTYSSDDIVQYAQQAHGHTYDVIFSEDGYVIARRVP